MRYRLIDHTADVGIKAFGKDPSELFTNAGFALFDLITDLSLISGKKNRVITIDGDNYEDLMINFLREILYLWSVEKYLIKKINVKEIHETHLTAQFEYDIFNEDIHEIKNEIKAATYHGLEVKKTNNGWVAQIIFDL